MKKYTLIILILLIVLSGCSASTKEEEVYTNPTSETNLSPDKPPEIELETEIGSDTESEPETEQESYTEETSSALGYVYHPEAFGCPHESNRYSGFHNIEEELLWYLCYTNENEYDFDVLSNEIIQRTSNYDDDCIHLCNKYTMYDFIRDYKIPREVMEFYCEYGKSYYYADYNLDLLYGNDYRATEEYYINKNFNTNSMENLRKRDEYNLKTRLGLELSFPIPEWEYLQQGIKYDEIGLTPCFASLMSIPEVIYYGDISRETVQDLLDNILSFNYDYDLDRIYNEKEEMLKIIEEARSKPTQLEQLAATRAIDVSIRTKNSE